MTIPVAHVIHPTKDFHYAIRHYRSATVDGEYVYEVFSMYASVGNKDGTDTHFYQSADNPEEDTTELENARPALIVKGEIGYPHLKATGEFFISKCGIAEFNQLMTVMLDIAFSMCDKVICVVCKTEHFSVMPSDSGSRLCDQGDNCAVYYSAKRRQFWGGYGSSLYDMHNLIPAINPDSELPWGTFDLPDKYGPYCDKCMSGWVKAGYLTVTSDQGKP